MEQAFCFKVLIIAHKTIIESAVAGVPIARGAFGFARDGVVVGATTRVAPGEAPILRGTRG